MKRFVKALWLPLLIVLLTLPALQPLWQPGLQQTYDGMHHLSRLFGLDQAIRAGHPGTRWLAEEGFGYGFPVLNFYGPLTYYVGLLWHWLGVGLVTSLEWTLAAGLALSVLAMYLFARRLLGNWGGALAAVAYAWAPYHLADAWTRGALAELWVFVWFPILMLALWEIARHRGRAMLVPTLWGSAALGGLILTHNPSVLLAAPLLMSWGLIILLVEAREATARWRGVGAYVLMVLLGLMVSAAFWLPVLTEARYIWASQVPMHFEDWKRELLPPSYLISVSWTQRYAALQVERALHPLGQAQVVLALIGVGAGLWRWRALDSRARWALPLMVALTFFALFMQTTASAGVWRVTPGLLLLPFPYRWQAITTVTLALLTGYAALTLDVSRAASLMQQGRTLSLAGVVIAAALLVMSSGLPGLEWVRSTYVASTQLADDATVDYRTVALYDYGRGLWLREFGGPWIFEYMPVWVRVPREEFFLPADSVATSGAPLAVQLKPGRQAPLERHFTAQSDAAWTLQLHQFYFPGWQAIVSGQTMLAEPTGPLGLAGVRVPAGEHEIIFRFGATASRSIGWGFSLVGLSVLLAGMIWLRRWRWLTVAAVALMLFGGLAVVQRHARPTDYTPTAVTVNFGDEVQLTSYALDPHQLRPEGDSTVMLNWLALRRPTKDYKVFLHLVDPTGKLWAQHDGEPGFWFSPTTRWQAGEFVEDRHMLEWHAAPPPGRYLLFVGLYDVNTGERLQTFGPDGVLIGDQVLVGEFEVAP